MAGVGGYPEATGLIIIGLGAGLSDYKPDQTPDTIRIINNFLKPMDSEGQEEIN